MRTAAVQSGPGLFNTSEQSTSQLLLILGAGILTYEIVSKAVQKIAQGFFAESFVVPLITSSMFMIAACFMKVPKLQAEFVLLCVLYVVVSVWTRGYKAGRASFPPEYMEDMVAEARAGAYISMKGYKAAREQVEVKMNVSVKANAILLAHPGVGKSAIPETIACRIANGLYSTKSVFAKAKLMRVDFTDLMAGTMYRGSLEARIKEMIQLAKKDPTIIYFIDEIHTLVGGGQTIESRVDISKLLLTAMARGDIRIIGASAYDDYRLHIEPKIAFARRLPPVRIQEPTHAKCFKMLRHSYMQKCEGSCIKVSDQAIAAAIYFTKDIPLRYFPDKAVDVIEDAVSKSQLDSISEDEITIDVLKIAQAHSANSPEARDVELLVSLFRTYINHNQGHFPGLTDGATLWIQSKTKLVL